MSETICRICSSKAPHKSYDVQEMLFGTRETFTYFLCSECGCLQIQEIPHDLGRHYPPSYYSFQPGSRVSRMLKHLRAQHLFSKKTLPGYVLDAVFGKPYYWKWLSPLCFKDMRSILDIGCGAGSLVDELSGTGVPRILGIDAFIASDRKLTKNCSVEKKTLNDISETFDFIMMNDSLEHLPNQLEVLRQVSQLMHRDSTLLVRIPILGHAWRKYGVHWANLDAPRHLYLHSHDSFKKLASQANLTIEKTLGDSNETQFAISEQYLRGIDQTHPKSYARGFEASDLTAGDLAEFQARTDELNDKLDGDHAAFYLKRHM